MWPFLNRNCNSQIQKSTFVLDWKATNCNDNIHPCPTLSKLACTLCDSRYYVSVTSTMISEMHILFVECFPPQSQRNALPNQILFSRKITFASNRSTHDRRISVSTTNLVSKPIPATHRYWIHYMNLCICVPKKRGLALKKNWARHTECFFAHFSSLFVLRGWGPWRRKFVLMISSKPSTHRQHGRLRGVTGRRKFALFRERVLLRIRLVHTFLACHVMFR